MVDPDSVLVQEFSERDSDECLLIDWENARKDRLDEAQDAERSHGGLTLEQFMEGAE